MLHFKAKMHQIRFRLGLTSKQWYVLNGNPSQNYGVSLAIWDHTVVPAARHKRTHPTLTPASEGWYSIYLPWKDWRLSWPRWLVTHEIVYPPTDSHQSKYYNGARRRVTTLIETNAITLSQATTLPLRKTQLDSLGSAIACSTPQTP